MRATLVNAPDSLIEERARLGIDTRDECWDGEWHLANPPKRWNVMLVGTLFEVLAPIARERGLVPYPDGLGIFGGERDWRVPDLALIRPGDEIDDGATSAAMVVEVRSPGDDSYAKLGFYAEREVDEVLVVHEDRRIELYRRRDDGTLVRVEHERGGARSEVLDVTFATVDGPKLLVGWDGGAAQV